MREWRHHPSDGSEITNRQLLHHKTRRNDNLRAIILEKSGLGTLSTTTIDAVTLETTILACEKKGRRRKRYHNGATTLSKTSDVSYILHVFNQDHTIEGHKRVTWVTFCAFLTEITQTDVVEAWIVTRITQNHTKRKTATESPYAGTDRREYKWAWQSERYKTSSNPNYI